jgi:hypothetical protein
VQRLYSSNLYAGQQPGAAAAVVPYNASTVQLLYLSPLMCRSAPSSPQELLQLVQLARILYTQFIPRSALLVKISHLKLKKLQETESVGMKQIYTD